MESCPGRERRWYLGRLNPALVQSELSAVLCPAAVRSTLCRLLQQSISPWAQPWLDPGLLAGSAASLHPSLPPCLPALCLGELIHCHSGTAGAALPHRGGIVSGCRACRGAIAPSPVFLWLFAGLLSWAAGDSLEEAAGGWLGAVPGRGGL